MISEYHFPKFEYAATSFIDDVECGGHALGKAALENFGCRQLKTLGNTFKTHQEVHI